MSKITTAIALIAIWLITLFAIVSICKVTGVELPLIAGVSSWNWLRGIFLVIELWSLLLESAL
jgi:hypothetical protein